jgi:hypothetical protein
MGVTWGRYGTKVRECPTQHSSTQQQFFITNSEIKYGEGGRLPKVYLCGSNTE